ncbi:MAG: hypothetical protein ACJAT7_001820 [Psychromonas sp.]|jgi:hypothetical protein|uniref:hypothetical protein n=1 Tax=Psychromonas sp. TaxID=1884585 RepID=UPI0039E42D9F
MDISGTVNLNNQPVTVHRNDPNSSTVANLASENQKQTQSVDQVVTEQPVQKSTELNKDLVNARVSEHQVMSSGNQLTADEAVGSLIDVRV